MMSALGAWGLGLVLGWLTQRLGTSGAPTWRRGAGVCAWVGLMVIMLWAARGEFPGKILLATVAGAGMRWAVWQIIREKSETKGVVP